jgi:hypothetical protein
MKTDFAQYYDKLIMLGELHYPLQKCLNILDVPDADIADFTKEFENEKSKVFQHWNKGRDKSDFDIDTKLLMLAKSGDINAIKLLDQRVFSRKNNG